MRRPCCFGIAVRPGLRRYHFEACVGIEPRSVILRNRLVAADIKSENASGSGKHPIACPGSTLVHSRLCDGAGIAGWLSRYLFFRNTLHAIVSRLPNLNSSGSGNLATQTSKRIFCRPIWRGPSSRVRCFDDKGRFDANECRCKPDVRDPLIAAAFTLTPGSL